MANYSRRTRHYPGHMEVEIQEVATMDGKAIPEKTVEEHEDDIIRALKSTMRQEAMR